MESFTLTLFVLGLLIVAFLVTQTIRRELKMREQLQGELRRESMHVRRAAATRGPHAPAMQQQTHKSPANSA